MCATVTGALALLLEEEMWLCNSLSAPPFFLNKFFISYVPLLCVLFFRIYDKMPNVYMRHHPTAPHRADDGSGTIECHNNMFGIHHASIFLCCRHCCCCDWLKGIEMKGWHCRDKHNVNFHLKKKCVLFSTPPNGWLVGARRAFAFQLDCEYPFLC